MVIFLSLLSISAALECNSFVCDSVAFPDPSLCVYTQSNVHYLKQCDSTSYSCLPTSSQNETSCTYYDGYSPRSLVPGDQCIYASDCYINNDCLNGICKGYSLGQKCIDNRMCDIGYYCSSAGLCSDLIQNGKPGCTQDTDCVTNSGCLVNSLTNSSQNQCTSYFSLSVGTKAAFMSEMLCSSGFSYENTCMAAPVSVKVPVVCTESSQCISKINGENVFNGTCTCGYNANGNAYCSLFAGDPIPQKAIKLIKLWSENSDILKCHTNDRFGKNCLIRNLGKDNAHDIFYYSIYSEFYPEIYGAENCALDIYFHDFYVYSKDISSYGFYMTASLGFLILS